MDSDIAEQQFIANRHAKSKYPKTPQIGLIQELISFTANNIVRGRTK
jgi:hypothetical protein